MGSRDKDNTTPHHPLLSSLVVRPADSGGGGAGSDYEPGEVRRDPPPHFRSDRYDDNGYRMRAGSASPVRRRDDHHRISPGFERSSGAPRSRGFGRGRGPPRHRHYSPPYGRSSFADKGYDRSGHGPGPLRRQELPRNNPNVQARDGDWVCSDPTCKNLNFARRDTCNSCTRSRYVPAMSPRSYSGPLIPPRQLYTGPPLDRSPRRIMYRSPPRAWSRDAPRAAGPPPPLRRNGRFPDPPPPLRCDRQDYPEEDLRDRYRHDRAMPLDFDHRDRGRDNNSNFNSRRGYGRRELSPLPVPELPHHPRGWAPPIRERSRSPVRGGPPVKEYRRDVYVNRGRGGRRGDFGRDRF